MQKSVRTSESDITLYKSVGSAVMDVAVGNAIFKNAERMGLGQSVAL